MLYLWCKGKCQGSSFHIHRPSINKIYLLVKKSSKVPLTRSMSSDLANIDTA